MTIFTQTTRILAIDPTTPGFAWIVLEGLHTIIDYGTALVGLPRGEKCRRRAEGLFASYQPDVVVMEDCGAPGCRRSLRAAATIDTIEECATARRIRSRKIARSDVLDAFAPQATTKHGIALTLATHFPELKPRLPRIRKPWMSEDERMNIFDALALAVTFAAYASGELPLIKA